MSPRRRLRATLEEQEADDAARPDDGQAVDLIGPILLPQMDGLINGTREPTQSGFAKKCAAALGC